MGSHLPRPLLLILLTVRLVAASSVPPPMPETQRSPAVLFRQLLAATSSQRSELLASKPEPARALIVAKLKEFEALPPDQRELRLQVAQLQFYLSPLLRAPATVRSNRLERVPPEDRPLLEERLQAWDALPEDTRREILETERSLSYFVRQESADPRKLAALLEQVPAPARPEIEAQFARWISLPAEERARKAAHFSRFFDLSGPERDKTLSRLPDVERQQMERTLAKFSSLPPELRDRCVRAFRQFGALSPEERSEFLQSAAKWQAMPADQRAAWRRLVQKIATPPLPPPPRPPLVQPRDTAVVVATNSPAH